MKLTRRLKPFIQLTLGAVALCGVEGLAHAQTFTQQSTPNPNPSPASNCILAISAASATNVWAVGAETMRFDGARWTAFPDAVVSVDPEAGSNSFFNGVTTLSATNAWAVGITGLNGSPSGHITPFIQNWNGTSWSLVSSPQFPNNSTALSAVASSSATSVWAVGQFVNGFGADAGLVEHFDGTAWTQSVTPQPAQGEAINLLAVSADSTTDAWAVGSSTINNTSVLPATLHFNGTSWQNATLPSLPRLVDGQLNGVVALSPTNVWAVGYTFPAGGATGPDHTLVEHFNGTSWTIVASPNPGNNSSNRFFSVTAISANDIWIGGATSSNKALNLTLAVQLANGSKFSVVNTPNPTGNNFESDLLFGATSDSSGNVWFGGTFEGKSSFDSLVLHASGG